MLPRTRAPFTHAIAIITIVAWALTLLMPPERSVLAGAFYPIRALDAGAIPQTLPFLLTPLSSALLHSGILHLGFNILVLLFCGRMVESALGSANTAILYVIGAYSAAAAQWASAPWETTPIIGASGAISALVGAYAVIFSQQRVRPIGRLSSHLVRIMWLAVAWIAIQLAFGVLYQGALGGSGIAAWEHIGGFICGLVLARPLLKLRYAG